MKAILAAAAFIWSAVALWCCGGSFPVPNTVTVSTADGSATVCTTIPLDKLSDAGPSSPAE